MNDALIVDRRQSLPRFEALFFFVLFQMIQAFYSVLLNEAMSNRRNQD